MIVLAGGAESLARLMRTDRSAAPRPARAEPARDGGVAKTPFHRRDKAAGEA